MYPIRYFILIVFFSAWTAKSQVPQRFQAGLSFGINTLGLPQTKGGILYDAGEYKYKWRPIVAPMPGIWMKYKVSKNWFLDGRAAYTQVGGLDLNTSVWTNVNTNQTATKETRMYQRFNRIDIMIGAGYRFKFLKKVFEASLQFRQMNFVSGSMSVHEKYTTDNQVTHEYFKRANPFNKKDFNYPAGPLKEHGLLLRLGMQINKRMSIETYYTGTQSIMYFNAEPMQDVIDLYGIYGRDFGVNVKIKLFHTKTYIKLPCGGAKGTVHH